MAVNRTLSLVSLVLLWQCTFFVADTFPLHTKKHHTMSPFKHHRLSLGSKNEIPHPHELAALKELGLGAHKAARETFPFGFATEKQTVKGHLKHAWGAFTPSHQRLSEQEGLSGTTVETASTSAEAAPEKPVAFDDGFEAWGPPIPTHTQKGSASGAFGSGLSKALSSSSTRDTSDVDDDGFGAWGAYQPSRHTSPGDDMVAGSTSKAIHVVPGQPPRVVEESFAGGDFGTFLSSSDSQEDAEDGSDGWFMSFVPYPQAPQEHAEVESSSSSSDAFADMFGFFRDRKRDCDDNVEDRSCKDNSDCRGCNRTFECSTDRKCHTV